MLNIFSYGPYVLRRKLFGKQLEVENKSNGRRAIVPNRAAEAINKVFAEIANRALARDVRAAAKGYALLGLAEYVFEVDGEYASLLMGTSASKFVDAALSTLPGHQTQNDPAPSPGWTEIYQGPNYRLEADANGALQVFVRGANAIVPVDREVQRQMAKVERELRSLPDLAPETLRLATGVIREYGCAATVVSRDLRAVFLEMTPTLFAMTVVAEAVDRSRKL
ncbi:hypothetical protein [Pseudooceanicola sp.]|uniref:hypothetical protein n=1 Tax=Pseudooceanicola sp. TaxID=1914328 RepID=UPI00405962BB